MSIFKLIFNQTKENKLFELNYALKNDLNELKLTNTKLQQENLDLHKSPGG